MSWITEARNFVSISYLKVALIVFLSSLTLLFRGLFSKIGLETHYYAVMEKYNAQITVVLVVSFVLIIFWFGNWIKENWINKGKQFSIISASYGVGNHHNDVTRKIKDLLKERDSFKVNDSNLLSRSKTDDPVPGEEKNLKIEYRYRHETEIKQGEEFKIHKQHQYGK